MACQISCVLSNLNKRHICTLYSTQLHMLTAKAVCLAASVVVEFSVDAAKRKWGERSLKKLLVNTTYKY